jgi:hypothetical protein
MQVTAMAAAILVINISLVWTRCRPHRRAVRRVLFVILFLPPGEDGPSDRGSVRNLDTHQSAKANP